MAQLSLRISLLVGILVTAACGSPDESPEPPIVPVDDSLRTATLIVNELTPLAPNDAALSERLARSGYEVRLATSIESWIEEYRHTDVMIVGPEAHRGDCDRLAKSHTPMVVMDVECMRGLELASTPSADDADALVALTIASEHPLAAGLAGQFHVTSEPQKLYAPSLGEGAVVIAESDTGAGASAIFSYENGASLLKGTAQARRVGMLVGGPQHFTMDGWQLFDAAVRWANEPRALIVIEGSEPTPSEASIAGRLSETLGFHAQYHSLESAGDALLEQAKRSRLIVLSHVSAGEPVAEKLADLPVPILTMEPSVLATLSMLDANAQQAFGTTLGQHSVVMQATEHVLAEQLIDTSDAPERRALTEEPISLGWGVPAPEAIVLASVSGAAERGALFAVDASPDSLEPTHAARRFAFLVGPEAAANFGAAGWQLFDRAVRWSARISDPGLVCMGRPDGASCADDDICNGTETCRAERCETTPPSQDVAEGPLCEQAINPGIRLDDNPVTLVATHRCQPGAEPTFEATEVDGEAGTSFQLPEALAVRLGNAGNATATFAYRSQSGETVRCTYRGGASTAHPKTELDIAKGRQYIFEGCTNGVLPGSALEADWFSMTLEGSACEAAPWRTEVEVELGANHCGRLPDPVSAVDSIVTRDNFKWADTNPVAEYDAQGRPSLYHAMIYIRSAEERALLDDMFIHYSLMPIFNSERSRYAGTCGSIEFEGDGQGLFVYAILPGVTFNELRKFALTPVNTAGDQEVFQVVKLVRPQDRFATNRDGSLRYETLGASGFRYMNKDSVASLQTQTSFLSGLIHEAANAVAEVTHSAVREVQASLAEVSVLLGVDAVPFYIDMTVLNRDPAFREDESLVSGWNGGEEIALAGVRVEVSQYVGGVVPVLFLASTNEEGAVTDLAVAKERTVQGICIASQNDAAEITSFVTETMVCGNSSSGYAGLGQVAIKREAGAGAFAPVLGSIRPGDLTFLTIETRNRFLHTLALISDSYDYAKTVIRKTPNPIEVLKGFTANRIGSFNGGAAFVPCFGHSTTALDTVIASVATAVGAAVGAVAGPGAGGSAAASVLAVLTAVASAIAVDMILPAGGTSDSFNSRGIVVHEYGHVVFCDLLYQANEGDVYTDMMLSRIESGAAGAADAHLAYVNEAFADFFFGQVAGAANYFRPSDLNTREEGHVYWCANSGPVTGDAETACFDNNVDNRMVFRGQVGRIASTLHDGFDGHFRGRVDQPNDAAMWAPDQDSKLVYDASYTSNSYDEDVAMEGACIDTVVRSFANRSASMRGDLRFLAGLSDAMQDPSCSEFGPPTWCDRCVLFANHDSAVVAGASRQEMYQACAAGELTTIVGAPPVANVDTLDASCTACPNGFRTTDGETCFFDPPVDCPASAPIAVFDEIEEQWTCEADCRPGFIFEDGRCLALID